VTTRTLSLSGALAGKTMNGRLTRDGSTETNGEATLPPGNAGTLATATSVTAASASHDIVTGATVDLFWSGATPGCRRGMVAGTVAGTTVPVSGGTGDTLPANGTAIVIDAQVIIDFDSTAASLLLVVVAQQRRASVQFQQNAGTPILSVDLGKYGEDGEPFCWASSTWVASPFGADVGKVAVSNGDSTGSNTVTIGALRT